MRRRKGDTLIEVALAIGIFSLVAISIVAVVAASTSSAQNSLEVTITREEIDAQAEALRFIHDSYIAGGQSNVVDNDRYLRLWRAITKNAKNRADSLDFNPTTCTELYNEQNGVSPLVNQGAFLINTRNLGAIGTADKSVLDSTIAKIVITPDKYNGAKPFYPATTYPRILYGTATGDESLLDQNDVSELDGRTISRADGIYIIAIKDNESTTIIDGSSATKKAAYYDFYLRTCWFSAGADRPSTVSTVIRLYDPNIITY